MAARIASSATIPRGTTNKGASSACGVSIRRGAANSTATITDGTTDIDITFFDARAHEHKLLPGARALFAGQVSEYRGRLQLAHPGYTILPEELSEAELAQRGPIPEYPYVKKLHNWTLAECVRLVLDHLDDLPDPLPDEVRAAHDLPDLTTTYRWLHRPDDLHQVERARERRRNRRNGCRRHGQYAQPADRARGERAEKAEPPALPAACSGLLRLRIGKRGANRFRRERRPAKTHPCRVI